MADYTLSVKITGDASGLEKAAQTAQSKLSTIGKGIGEVGQGLTNKITKPALGAATAVAGITIGKGFSRMIEIDNARAKLQALGMDADAIKDSARLAVEDTAFSLNKAMTTAASAAAAGIQPGEQMTKYLTAIADAAAVAGTDMDEMGAIFNKVATNGKISAEEINQLSDRGIPAVQLLAKATGKSMEEVREAISNGEIGVEELQEAIEIGMPEAAKAIGSSTISGAFSNFNAAIARVGENLIGSADKGDTFAGRLLPLLNAINGAMGLVETKASELGAKLAESVGPPMDKLTDLIQRFAEGEVKIDAAKAKIAALGSVASVALGPAMVGVSKGIAAFDKLKGAVGTLGNIFGKSSGQILKMGGIIGLVVAAFGIAYTRSESFRNAVNGLVSAIGGALLSVFKALSPIIQTAFGLFNDFRDGIGAGHTADIADHIQNRDGTGRCSVGPFADHCFCSRNRGKDHIISDADRDVYYSDSGRSDPRGDNCDNRNHQRDSRSCDSHGQSAHEHLECDQSYSIICMEWHQDNSRNDLECNQDSSNDTDQHSEDAGKQCY